MIVADAGTTSIAGGAGDDVIIGHPNTVAITGGDSWDYIVGNSFGAVLIGGSGDDIIDAGPPSAPTDQIPSVEAQLELAASSLSDSDAARFHQAVVEKLGKAQDAALAPARPNLHLRQKAIESNPVVQQVIGTSGTTAGRGDVELPAEIEALETEIQAYSDATSWLNGLTDRERPAGRWCPP